MPADSEEIDVFIAALEANFGTSVSEIPDYFVEKAYDSNFCEYEEADGAVDVTTYRAEGFSIALKNVMESLEVLVEKGTEAPIFDQMAERSVPVKKIVTLAWIAIEEALANDQDQFVRKNGIYATRMYMLLSCLNGASAFEIFSKFLFVRSIEQVRQVMAEKLDAHRKRLLSFAMDGIFALLGHVSLAAEDGVLAVALLVRDAIRVDLSDDTRVDSVSSLEGFADVRRISEKSFAILHRLLDDRHVSGRNTVMGKVLLNRLMCYGSQDEVLPQIQKISAPMLLYRDRVIAFLTKRAEGGQPAELKMIFDLVKNLFRCPDRSDYKDKVAESAMGLLHLLPAAYHVKFVEFVDLAYCQPDLGSMRSFTVEILPQFIKAFDLSAPIENLIEEEVGEEEDSGAEAPREEVEKAENEGSEDEEEVQRRSKKKAQKTREAQRKERSELDPVSTPVQILVEAVYDKSSSIRAKALAHLGSLFGIPEKFALIEKICSGAFDEAKLRQKSVPGQEYPTPLLLIVLQAGDDERVAVRKAAIGVLAKLFNHLLEEDHVRYTLREMTDLTRDCAIAVRKEAAEKLTEVFRNHEDVEIVRRSWLDSIMPLLVDREQSVQQLAAKIVMEIIFAQLSSAVPSDYVWMLLADIEKDFNVRRLLYRSMRALHEQSLLPQSLVTVVSRYAQEEDKRAPVWLLLSFLSKIFTVPPQMAFSYWFQLDVEAHATMVPTYVCNILVETHKKLSETQKNQLKADLKSRIIRFDVQAKNVPAVFYLYAKLNDAVGEEARGQQQFGSFCQSLGKRVAGMICEVVYGRPMKELPFNDGPLDSQTLVSDATTSRPATAIPNVRPEDVSENKVVTMLQVVGECVQYEPKTCTDKLAKIFKYIFASDYALHTDDEEDIDLRANLVMSEVAEEVPFGSQPITQRSQAVVKFWQDHKLLQNVTSKRVRAVCAITMCRICLQHEKLAKECIPVFARELRNNRDHIIRNNLIVGISDLCVRYTLMVDRYVTVMALCLTDSSVFVRQQTITLLTILIKEQFLKCEGQILYKLIAALNDDHKDIRDYLYFCLVEVLLAQFPSMFSNHFLECVFYFNGADHGHQASLEGQENSKKHEYEHMRSNIQGAANMVKRMRLYKFMLSMMTDAQRFAIWVRLVFEVANKISQGTMDYKKKVYENILIDTLNLMCCDEIKMHSVMKKKESEGGEGSEEAPSEEIPGDKAISKLTAFFRSRVGELILPGMLELRAFLLEKRSPILKLVMNALMELVKDYEEQFDSFFASNRQAKAELEWDLKTAKEAQEEDRRVQEMAQVNLEAQKENRAVSVVPNTSMARAPCTPVNRTTRSASAMEMGTVPRSMRRKSNIFEKSASEKSMIYDERAEENPLAEYRAPCDYGDNDMDPPSRASILCSPFRSQNESPMISRLVDSPGSSRSSAVDAAEDKTTRKVKKANRTTGRSPKVPSTIEEENEQPEEGRRTRSRTAQRSVFPAAAAIDESVFGRAVSTPEAMLAGVTFAMDLELSSIAGTPVRRPLRKKKK